MTDKANRMPSEKTAQTLPAMLRALADEVEKGAPLEAAVVITSHGPDKDMGLFTFGTAPGAGSKLMRDAAITVLERDRMGAKVVMPPHGGPLS